MHAIALRARFPVLLIGSALVFGIYGFGRKLYGEGPDLMAAALAAFSAFEGLRIHPHHLSYVSAAVGGPERGPYLLDESNIDWGQDLPALARWQRGRPADERVRLFYFGSADPEAYGVRSEPFDPLDRVAPRPGLYAISAHQLVGFRKR